MKYTVLELTQNILSSMDSDEVTSINDTTESLQVANIIQTAYYSIITRADLPEHEQLFNLNVDDTIPVLTSRDDNIARIDWIKYNNVTTDGVDNYQYVTVLPLQQFVDQMHQVNSTDISTETFTLDNNTFYFKNDKRPEYCTVVNNTAVVFDSYDNQIDTLGLDQTKIMAFGQVLPAFELGDAFVPDLDDEQFPLLLNEAKSQAFVELKQAQNAYADREARRQWTNLQKNKALAKPNYFNELPFFGRR